jgi:hypothetical protein
MLPGNKIFEQKQPGTCNGKTGRAQTYFNSFTTQKALPLQ